MRILILKDFVPDAASIKDRILANQPFFESVLICQSPADAIEQVERFGTHLIILDLAKGGAEEFLAQVKNHPHRIVGIPADISTDYFEARLFGLNQMNSLNKQPLTAPAPEYSQHSPSFSV